MNLAGLLEKYRITPKGVVHVGAHKGLEFPIYKQMGVSNILMFEPQPHLANLVKANYGSDSSLIVEQLAVGESDGQMEMFIETANEGQSSSLLKPKVHLEQYPYITFNSKLPVQVVTLDSYFADKGTSSLYNVLNMDIQGYELHALKGSSTLLKTLDAVYLEVNRAELYEGCGMVTDIDSYLAPFGFNRVETDWMGDTWGDALYTKQ